MEQVYVQQHFKDFQIVYEVSHRISTCSFIHGQEKKPHRHA